MKRIKIDALELRSDPDLELGGILTLERADGRSVWRQRLQVIRKHDGPSALRYKFRPIDEFDNPY